MRKKPWSLLFAGVLCVLLFAGWTANAEKSEGSRKGWEYKVVRLCATETDLNALGKEGWELTSVEPSGRFVCPAFYFKRAR